MSKVTVINLPNISGIDKCPNDLIKRDALIENVLKNFETKDIIFIEGDSGVGKSVFLRDFVWSNSRDTISHFIVEDYQYTHTVNCILDNLYRQLYFYCRSEIYDSTEFVDNQAFTSIQGHLFKKIKSNDRPLYFVFDGFHHLTNRELEDFKTVLTLLPQGKAKFLISGSIEVLGDLGFGKNLTKREIPILKFGLEETRIYFRELTTDESEIQELHRLAKNGLPVDLAFIKKACIDIGSTKAFLSDGGRDKEEILASHWKQIDHLNKNLINVLSLIAFTDIQMSIEIICSTLDIKETELLDAIKDITFIEKENEVFTYSSEVYRKYAKHKLKEQEQDVLSRLIQYYEKNDTDDKSKFNLPDLYRKVGNWKAITNFFTLDKFVELVSHHESLNAVNKRFSEALEASTKESTEFNPARLRFAIHKSSFLDVQKYEIWESEIEALLVHEDYSKALTLANSVFLKEDRLKLLAVLAKQMKLNDMEPDSDLLEQIRQLYSSIDFTNIPDKGLEISQILVYSCFDIAIELVESLSKNKGQESSIDYALAYLSLYARQANKKSNVNLVDIDALNSKIKNNDVRNLSSAIGYISDDYKSKQVIEKVAKFDSFIQKVFLLKNWIINNSENDEVAEVIEYLLELIIISSTENVTSASTLESIARPLPNIKNKETLISLIDKFDVLKGIVTNPTIDFVLLQLTLARSIFHINPTKSEDRIYDMFLLIDEIGDLSLKTDCLCVLWSELLKIDPRGKIEQKLINNSSLKAVITDNIELLYKGTAFQLKTIDKLIEYCINVNFEWVCEIIELLNTNERKENAYLHAAMVILEVEDLSKVSFDKLNLLISKLNLQNDKDIIIREIIERFLDNEMAIDTNIEQLIKFYPDILKIDDIAKKSYVLTNFIGILTKAKTNNKSLIIEVQSKLELAWENIDVQWRKVEIGFLIAKDLVKYSKEEAKKYLDKATELKAKQPFSSDSIVMTYLKSASLCIQAFGAIIVTKDKIDDEITKIDVVINFVQSTGEKLKLWNEVALMLLSKNKLDEFNRIYKEHINPLLGKWSKIDTTYKKNVIVLMAPVIYHFHHLTFLNDYLTKLEYDKWNESLSKICSFILTKQPNEEISDDFKLKIKLDYTEFKDLILLLEYFKDDFQLYQYIKYTIKSLKSNKSALPQEQFQAIKRKILDIIQSKFPFQGGIQHEGYKVVSEAHLMSMEIHNPQDWEHLLDRARKIPNLSDSAVILITIADCITTKSNKKKIEIITEAFEIIKTIPSVYDKSIRFGSIWETLLDIDKGKFSQFLKLAFIELMGSSDRGEEDSLKNLIDLAYQHDKNLADSLITMLDNDPARKLMKKPIQIELESKEKVNKAKSDYKAIKTLTTEQFESMFNNSLIDLNLGKLVTKPILETLDILDKISEIPLTNSYSAISYFVQNAGRKYEKNTKNLNVLESIFDSLFENTRLIMVLTSENLDKMRALNGAQIGKIETNSPLIRIGETDKASDFINNWISHNVSTKLYIIDPYFSEKQLDFIQKFQESSNNSLITILTSKSNGINSHIDLKSSDVSTNPMVYNRAWSKISSEIPKIRIRIVWDKNTKSSPFHDRYILADDLKKGLFLGTSLNGFGKKDAQIHELSTLALLPAIEIVENYIFRQEYESGSLELKYEGFDIF